MAGWNPLKNTNPNSGDPYAPPNDGDSPNDEMNNLIQQYKPLIQKMTFSSFMGYCSGITAKKVGKSMAFVIGLAFIGLQGLVYKGYIAVDWKEVQGSVVKAVDTVR
jgi:uncharacterized membrane protein (Fun14 family)